MGYGTGSLLTEDQTALLNVGRKAIPPEFSQTGEESQELFGAFAVEMGAAKTSIDADYHRTMILDSTGIWLDQHARDRGTARQANESDSSLQTRLRSFNPSVTLAAMTASVNTFASGSGVTGSIGYVELRRQKGFMSQLPLVFVAVSASQITTGSYVQIGLAGRGQDTFVFGTTGSSPPGTFYVSLASASSPFDVASSFASAVASASLVGLVGGLHYTVYWEPRLQNTARIFNGSGSSTSPLSLLRLSGSVSSGALYSVMTGSHGAYMSRGYRMGSLPPLNELIVITPTGTLDATRTGIQEVLRQKKPAGLKVVVERRGAP